MYLIKYIIKYNYFLLQNFFVYFNMNIGCLGEIFIGSGSILYIVIFSCL